MAQLRSISEINEKISKGQAVVVTAEEVISLVEEHGVEETAKRVDVVTTGTFGPMCSSGAFLNLGHPTPRMRMSKVFLNSVNAYAGIAAVDVFIGATEIPDVDPANKNFPGAFNYGGAHVIEDLVAGREVYLEAESYGTDCYPRQKLETWIKLSDINEAYLFNPRNCYQNYNVAVNLSDRTIYTYMGILKPNLGNANYCRRSYGVFNPCTFYVGYHIWHCIRCGWRDHGIYFPRSAFTYSKRARWKSVFSLWCSWWYDCYGRKPAAVYIESRGKDPFD